MWKHAYKIRNGCAAIPGFIFKVYVHIWTRAQSEEAEERKAILFDSWQHTDFRNTN